MAPHASSSSKVSLDNILTLKNAAKFQMKIVRLAASDNDFRLTGLVVSSSSKVRLDNRLTLNKWGNYYLFDREHVCERVRKVQMGDLFLDIFVSNNR